jgi:hypothetical protein
MEERMSDLDADRERFSALLHSYIADAISAHPRETRKRLRGLIDAGAYRVSSRFRLDMLGDPAPDTLTYVVAVACRQEDGSVGAVELCDVHWTRLEMTPAQVAAEPATTKRMRAARHPAIELVDPTDPSPQPEA